MGKIAPSFKKSNVPSGYTFTSVASDKAFFNIFKNNLKCNYYL